MKSIHLAQPLGEMDRFVAVTGRARSAPADGGRPLEIFDDELVGALTVDPASVCAHVTST